ncbi:MAG: CehA/McbA family metallohydrolase [Roseiflexaceae bacterium]
MHYTFRGSLNERDAKRHIPHTFQVPEGTSQITLDLQFAPAVVQGAKNMLCLTLIGPQGFRGAGHRLLPTEHVMVGITQSTPGYLAGPIPAGEWIAWIDTHMVIAGEPCQYLLEISTSDQPVSAAAAPLAVGAARSPRGDGWYRGDLHAHTIHSDAIWDVADLLAAARSYHLDFVTISDHNTIAHLHGIEALSDDTLLVMGGMELTTYWGHALSLGTRQWIDWRVGPQRTMPQIAREVLALGGLFVIAHPRVQGDPICTGCDWRYVEMEPGPAPAVEIWNGGIWADENERGLALYYEWLNAGHRLVATAGTDAHGPVPEEYREHVKPGFNVVYAAELSEAGILAAIARGHLFVSCGPHLELHAVQADGLQAMMGDLLPAGAAEFSATWQAVPAASTLRIIADGICIATIAAAGEGQYCWRAAEWRWCTAELRAADGSLLAVTNPIFGA